MLVSHSKTTVSLQVSQPLNERPEISRLLAAAVINAQFREFLLADPKQALQQGYQGEKFNLNAEEQQTIVSIRAQSLKHFTSALIESVGIHTGMPLHSLLHTDTGIR